MTFSFSTATTSSQTFNWAMPTRDPDQPYLHGGTVSEFSTCTTLAIRRPVLIWDVNRYYRDLGLSAPYMPTRPEIRRAFRMGARGPRETFCFKQLMDEPVRRHYDWAPWGVKMMDPFVWQQKKDDILAQMLKRRMDIEDEGLIRRVFETMGIPLEEPESESDTPGKDSPDILDNGDESGQDEPVPNEAPAIYAFAYYLWKTSDREQDREVLARWQPLIIRALSDQGVTMGVSLGLMGRTPHQWSVGIVGRRTVAYLNRMTEPSEEVAVKVATALAAHHRST